jgi:hypothetical protein
MQSNLQSIKETNSKTNNSQTNSNRGNIMEYNLVEAFCGIFSCEEVIKSEDRAYDFKSVLMSPVEGICFIYPIN